LIRLAPCISTFGVQDNAENQNLKCCLNEDNGKITALLKQHSGSVNARVVFYLEGSPSGSIAGVDTLCVT